MRINKILHCTFKAYHRKTQESVFFVIKLGRKKSTANSFGREQRIHFTFHAKMNKKLEHLENKGIIEDVEGDPTPW